MFALIEDNWTVNQSISEKLVISLNGCARHRFPFTVRYTLKKHEVDISIIYRLIVKLRTPIMAVHFCRKTHLTAITNNKTR